MPAGPAAPDGVLGTVTSVTPKPDGTTEVATVPATLDEAYSTFKVAVSADLSESDVSVVRSDGRAQGTPFKLNLSKANFSCTGPGPTITIAADLSRIHLDFNLDIWRPSIYFLLDVRPVFELGLGITGQVTCTLAGGALLKARIPIAATPPIDITLEPVVTLSAGGQVSVNFRWEPSMTFGFERAPGVSQDFRSFGSTGSVGVSGSAGMELFAGLSAKLSLAGGRAAVTGEFGPVLTAQIDTAGCRTVEAALRVQLSAEIDLFIKNWTFALATGTFAKRRIYSSCKPGLRSWGSNYAGQLGVGTTSGQSSYPGPVVLDNIANTDGPLAARGDGTVWAWGNNRSAQLGRPTSTVTSGTPARVSGVLGATAVGSGVSTNYALRSDRTVWAWGDDSVGQLGRGRRGPTANPTPTRVPGLTDVTAIAAGSFSALALRADGTVWAWGWLASTSGVPCAWPSDCVFAPIRVRGLSGVTAIASGSLTAYALRSDGTVWSWGHNLSGELGNGSTAESSVVPVRVTGLTNIRQLAAGYQAAFALRSDGTVWAWGNNQGGALGNGTYCDTCLSRVPVQVSGMTNAKSIAAGGYGTIGWYASTYNTAYALRTDGTVWSWGDNESGQLGTGGSCSSLTHCPRTVPAQIQGLSNITLIAASDMTGYAVVGG